MDSNVRIIKLVPEGFKIIPSYPDFAVNGEGKVMSVKTGKFRKIQLDRNDMLMVPLSKNGEPSSSRYLVYMICEAFHGLCPYKIRKISYKDLDSDNIRPENIFWKNTDVSDNLTKERRARFLSKTF